MGALRFWPDLEIVNGGIRSDYSEVLLARVGTIVPGSPKKVFIIIGTNDVSRGEGRSETVANVRAALQEISQGLPDAEIYLQSVLPRTSKYAAEIEALNAGYTSLCEELVFKGANGYMD